jgi:hypothetical protein
MGAGQKKWISACIWPHVRRERQRNKTNRNTSIERTMLAHLVWASSTSAHLEFYFETILHSTWTIFGAVVYMFFAWSLHLRIRLRATLPRQVELHRLNIMLLWFRPINPTPDKFTLPCRRDYSDRACRHFACGTYLLLCSFEQRLKLFAYGLTEAHTYTPQQYCI